MLAPLAALIERGRRDGTFRTDVPADWLVTLHFALVHGAEEHAAGHDADRTRMLQLLQGSLTDLFTAGASDAPPTTTTPS